MGKPTCQVGKLETVSQNQLDRKRESAKIYDKSSQIQKRQQLTKEGATSFLEFKS